MSSPDSPHEFPAMPVLSRQGTALHLTVDSQPFIALGGQIHNSSASDLAYMEARVWHKLVEHNCNTVFAPVYWELLEPEEGHFDFSLVDGLLAGARKRNLRVILLWFGTWKNGFSTYASAWVKTDCGRFPRMEREPGRACAALSPFGEETLSADARAFRALMKHLRACDSAHRTVIMMQVENEPGLLGAPRDLSVPAERAFASPIPSELHAALLERKAADALRPELQQLRLAAHGSSASWSETFGEIAEEAFMAWHIARYINRVAREGRDEYPLPCYANSWLVQYPGQHPGEYPSGGPVSRMMDIWQIAGPDLFAIAPDIYIDAFADVCADYASHGNPLFIPEAGNRRKEASAHALYSIGKHGTISFAPFGIDSTNDPLLAKTYRLLAGLMPLITASHGTGRMTAILQGPPVSNGVGPAPGAHCGEKEILLLQNYRAEVRYHNPRQADRPPAAALIIQESPDTLVIAGLGGVDINFIGRELAPGGQRLQADFISLEEGEYRDGVWCPGRRLNGDEYVVRLGSEPAILRATLYRYA